MKVPHQPDEVFAALAALAARKPDGRRVRRSIAENVANAAGQAKRREKLRREAWERRKAELAAAPPRRRRPAYGDRLQDRIIMAMQPGCWHSTSDIWAAIGAPRNSRVKLRQDVAWRGYVESAKDPDGTAWLNGDVMRLWRLTRRGELEREALALLE